MKIEELMIGDWYWWEAEGKKYPMQVTRDTFTLADDDIANFEPIPLTPEILEKNGYTHDELTEQCIKNLHSVIDIAYLISDDHRIIVHNDITCLNSNNKWNVHIDSEDFSTIATSEITYVHQLQHLLNDNNIEKKIIL